MEIFLTNIGKQINLNPDDINYICIDIQTRINLKIGIDILIGMSGLIMVLEQNTQNVKACGLENVTSFLKTLNKT